MNELKENEDLYLYLMGRWRDIEKDGYLDYTITNVITLATMHLTSIWEYSEEWNPFVDMNADELYEFYQGFSRDRVWDVWMQFYDELRVNGPFSCEIKSLPGYIKYCSFMDDLFDYLDELGYKDGDYITLKDAEKGLRILKVKLKGYIAGIDLANIYGED